MNRRGWISLDEGTWWWIVAGWKDCGGLFQNFDNVIEVVLDTKRNWVEKWSLTRS
jgi:hypothetical protein